MSIFALEPDELGCTSAISMNLNDDEPFKEHFTPCLY